MCIYVLTLNIRFELRIIVYRKFIIIFQDENMTFTIIMVSQNDGYILIPLVSLLANMMVFNEISDKYFSSNSNRSFRCLKFQ